MNKTKKRKASAKNDRFPKCPTGIKGFDEITDGGLPRHRNTLLCGNTGCGKTLFGIDFLINGAVDYDELGVFMTFEETEEEIYRDLSSLELDLKGLVLKKKIHVQYVALERRDFQENGEYNLEGLFILLEHAIDAVGAKRVVLDSIESLFAGVTDSGILRLEVKRLFRWLKKKGVTSIITGEMSADSYTHHGLEEFISDCIILLDNRVKEQIAIRRVRVVKYRGSDHGTNEYPFVIDTGGLSVIPITSAGLDEPGTGQKVSCGIPSLDRLFKGRKGYTRGSTILVSGTAGTGKTSIAAAFAIESCRRGEKCIFLSYEESAGQLVQNMRSIDLHFEPWIKKGLLKIVATRPSFFGLEMHLLDLYKMLDDFKPKAVVIDTLTSLIGEGDEREIRSMVTRMIDRLKSNGITAFFSSLVSAASQNDTSGEIGVSSLIDTWIVVRELEEDKGRKRIRGLFIVKSRGTAHSSDVHKLVLSDSGISLIPMDAASGATGKSRAEKSNSQAQ